jgi:SNF2 family DNA or RNA helicase
MPMSGTPFLNNPLELWPVLHRLWPNKFPSYWQFEANLVIKDGGERIAYNPDEDGPELRSWLQAHTVRRRKDQVGIEMPDVIYSTVMVPMTAEQRRLYNKHRERDAYGVGGRHDQDRPRCATQDHAAEAGVLLT